MIFKLLEYINESSKIRFENLIFKFLHIVKKKINSLLGIIEIRCLIEKGKINLCNSPLNTIARISNTSNTLNKRRLMSKIKCYAIKNMKNIFQ